MKSQVSRLCLLDKGVCMFTSLTQTTMHPLLAWQLERSNRNTIHVKVAYLIQHLMAAHDYEKRPMGMKTAIPRRFKGNARRMKPLQCKNRRQT